MSKTMFVHHGLLCLVILFSSGCAVKYGNYSISDSGTKEIMDNKDYWAFEAHTKPFWNDKVDMNFGVGYLDGPDYGELQTNMGPISATNIFMMDFYTTMRYYPLGARDTDFFLKPYIGGGVGYFNLRSKTRTRGDRVGGDVFFDYYEIDESNDTMAKGFNPHIVFGTYIPIGNSDWSFVIEDRIDFGKTDNGFDLGGNVIMFGINLDIEF